MASTIFITFLFLSIILNSPTTINSQECPYPCYPPPTGPGNVPPAAPTPPSTSYNPPPAFKAPPQGYLPNYPPPPYFVNRVVPPPPNNMVPWFPYYPRKPPRGTSDQSSSAAFRAWTPMIASIPLLLMLIFH